MGAEGSAAGAVPCTLRQFLLYFLRLGATGFGGPIALAGAMQRDLVEERCWVTKQDYVEGLALAQLAPGPLAAQLAMHCQELFMVFLREDGRQWETSYPKSAGDSH